MRSRKVPVEEILQNFVDYILTFLHWNLCRGAYDVHTGLLANSVVRQDHAEVRSNQISLEEDILSILVSKI